ncbi:MAG: hypothetical protein CMH71_01775 [Nitrosopumilales archaeon]|nr:hypothetical protein [Nitrosopumilales archaeon]
MGVTCKGICLQFKHTSLQNGEKYSSGLKRCTECAIFMNIEDFRCPCCRVKLRTKSRSKR